MSRSLRENKDLWTGVIYAPFKKVKLWPDLLFLPRCAFQTAFFKQKKLANFFANLDADSALGGWSQEAPGLALMCKTKPLLLLAFFIGNGQAAFLPKGGLAST